MSVSPSFQGKPADLKAEIAGLHMLLDPRLVALHAQSIPTFGEKKGLIFHLQLLFILGLEGLLQYKKKRVMNDQVQLPPERQGGHLPTEEGEDKV